MRMNEPFVGNWTLDEHGHLKDPTQWTRAFGQAVADHEGITLTDDHWWLIEWVRAYWLRYGNPPLMRTVVQAVRDHKADPNLGSAVLYGWFSEHPIREACRLGGLPKPDWCL
jgi:tRNA 2-thiouridine synthesizing protein E